VEVFNRYAPADTTGPSGTKNKTEVQGSQSTVAYISRRMLCSIFSVTIVEDDKDGNAQVQTITDKQAADLRALAEETKKSGETAKAVLENFCAYYKIDKIENLPVSLYQSAVAEFNRKRAKAK